MPSLQLQGTTGVIIPGSSKYVKLVPFGRIFGWKGTNFTHLEDPGIKHCTIEGEIPQKGNAMIPELIWPLKIRLGKRKGIVSSKKTTCRWHVSFSFRDGIYVICLWKKSRDLQGFIIFYTSQVVQDLFDQQCVSLSSKKTTILVLGWNFQWTQNPREHDMAYSQPSLSEKNTFFPDRNMKKHPLITETFAPTVGYVLLPNEWRVNGVFPRHK